MSTAATSKVATSNKTQGKVLARILQEGYGPGAWHGADFKAALGDVTPALAFWRPGPGRHNIAEIAMHHAFSARSVRGQLAGGKLEKFPLDGEDWFALSKESPLSWAEILDVVQTQQEKLAAAVADLGLGRQPNADVDAFQLVLGITCHAVYHAGQVQLIKRLRAEG
jgi:hypothetical protein